MPSYEINEQGLEALARLISSMNSSVESIKHEGEHLLSAASANSEVIGPHAGQVIEITDTIEKNTKELGELIEGLAAAVQELISKYETIISRKIYVDADSSDGSSPGPKVKTLHR